MMQVCYQTIRLTAPDVSAKSSCDRTNGFYGRCRFKIKFMDTETREEKVFPMLSLLFWQTVSSIKKKSKATKDKQNFFLASAAYPHLQWHFQLFFTDIESSQVYRGKEKLGNKNRRQVQWLLISDFVFMSTIKIGLDIRAPQNYKK